MSLVDVAALTDDQARQLHAMYQEEWWTKGRVLSDVRTMLRHTDYVFGLCEPGSGRLAAFARVLTDRVFKVFIFDLIVGREHRGGGLGSRLMRRILEHPDLRTTRHFELCCLPEMTPYYRRFGFSTDVGGLLVMRREALRGHAP